MNNGEIITKAMMVFLQKTFGNRINRNEQLRYPKQCIPNLGFGLSAHEVNGKHRASHIKQHTKQGVFLPPFDDEIFANK